jgi:hypothetical protein
MNTYDPADYITYVSMDRQFHPPVGLGPSDAMENHLPEGYAGDSPKTPPAEPRRDPDLPVGWAASAATRAGIGPGYPKWSPRTSGTA